MISVDAIAARLAQLPTRLLGRNLCKCPIELNQLPFRGGTQAGILPT
jgi:hypothetical protein